MNYEKLWQMFSKAIMRKKPCASTIAYLLQEFASSPKGYEPCQNCGAPVYGKSICDFCLTWPRTKGED